MKKPIGLYVVSNPRCIGYVVVRIDCLLIQQVPSVDQWPPYSKKCLVIFLESFP